MKRISKIIQSLKGASYKALIRAEKEFQGSGAKGYRSADERVVRIRENELIVILKYVASQFLNSVTALELGCGTGRYFHALNNVERLIGIDISHEMLKEAKHPVNKDTITIKEISLVEGDIFSLPFKEGVFDFIYSIGVLGEHTDFNEDIAKTVFNTLKKGGVFLFTVVKPRSKSFKRNRSVINAVRLLYPIMPFPIKRGVGKRGIFISGFCASSSYVERVLKKCGFSIERMRTIFEQTYPHYIFIAKKI